MLREVSGFVWDARKGLLLKIRVSGLSVKAGVQLIALTCPSCRLNNCFVMRDANAESGATIHQFFPTRHRPFATGDKVPKLICTPVRIISTYTVRILGEPLTFTLCFPVIIGMKWFMPIYKVANTQG